MKTLFSVLFVLLLVVSAGASEVTIHFYDGSSETWSNYGATVDSYGNITVTTPDMNTCLYPSPSPIPAYEFTPEYLPEGMVNAYYAQDVCLVGATSEPPIILTGYLPPGITWQRHGNCYLLSGKPLYAGVYQFTVAALDISKTYTFLVVTYR